MNLTIGQNVLRNQLRFSRRGSFLEKPSKKSTCAVMIRIIITFASEICL